MLLGGIPPHFCFSHFPLDFSDTLHEAEGVPGFFCFMPEFGRELIQMTGGREDALGADTVSTIKKGNKCQNESQVAIGTSPGACTRHEFLLHGKQTQENHLPTLLHPPTCGGKPNVTAAMWLQHLGC